MKEVWIEEEIFIKDIESLLIENVVEVEGPDGWVNVSKYVDKGLKKEYVLITSSGKEVRSSANHLYKSNHGWKFAKDLTSDDLISTIDGYEFFSITKTGNLIPVVDITVDHENHRYYTNGVESHNTGGGKSMLMCHMAAANMLAGYNVLYITMEMSEEKIAERIDANCLNIDISTIPDLKKPDYLQKFAKLRDKVRGKLIVKEYPNGQAHAGHFRYLINELKMKKGFVPDVLYVDYLGICASLRRKVSSSNSYEYGKSIAEELRALGQEFNIAVWTAIQTNRGGLGNSDVDLTNTSESIGGPMTADLLFAMVETEELINLGQKLVIQLKNRYNDMNNPKRFVVGVDKAKMKFYDVESHGQAGITGGPVDVKPPSHSFGDFA